MKLIKSVYIKIVPIFNKVFFWLNCISSCCSDHFLYVDSTLLHAWLIVHCTWFQIEEYECQREHFNHLAGWKPNLQTSTFWHTISLSPCRSPSLLPILRFHHLISHPPCHRDLLNPPSLLHQNTSLPPSLSLKCHLHFSLHILTIEFPEDGLISPVSAATSAARCAHCGRGWWGLNLCACLRICSVHSCNAGTRISL